MRGRLYERTKRNQSQKPIATCPRHLTPEIRIWAPAGANPIRTSRVSLNGPYLSPGSAGPSVKASRGLGLRGRLCLACKGHPNLTPEMLSRSEEYHATTGLASEPQPQHSARSGPLQYRRASNCRRWSGPKAPPSFVFPCTDQKCIAALWFVAFPPKCAHPLIGHRACHPGQCSGFRHQRLNPTSLHSITTT